MTSEIDNVGDPGPSRNGGLHQNILEKQGVTVASYYVPFTAVSQHGHEPVK